MTSLTSGVSRRCLMSAALASSRSLTAAASMSTSGAMRQREEMHSPPASSPSSSLRPPSCQMDNLMGEMMKPYLFPSKIEKCASWVSLSSNSLQNNAMSSPQTLGAAPSLTRTATVSVNPCVNSCAMSWRRCRPSSRKTASPPRRSGGGSGNRYNVERKNVFYLVHRCMCYVCTMQISTREISLYTYPI